MIETCKNLGSCHVILVEDDQLLQAIMSMELEGSGINSCAASNGQQALALVKSHRPKVLILDIAIGNFSGFDVIEAMKNDPDIETLKSMHVIVHTSQDLSQEEQNRLSFGTVHFLIKTVGSVNVAQLVSQICKEN